jgi:hypothetical protein
MRFIIAIGQELRCDPSTRSGLVKTMLDPEQTAKVLDFINGNDHFFLNLSMPASKAFSIRPQYSGFSIAL